MNNTKQQDRILSFFLFAGLFFGLFYLYFAQERLYQKMTTGSLTLGVEKYLRILSVICIFIASFTSIFSARTKYLISVFFAYLILLLTIVLNYVLSGADLFDMAQFMSNRGIGTWVCLGLIFIGYDDKRYAFFQKFLYLSILVISALCLYNFIDFGIGLWRGQALSKYRVYATNMVWITPYVFLILKNKPNLKWLRLSAIFMGVILALITQTRSFLLIFLITLFFDFYHTKNKRSYFIFLILGIFGLIYLVLNTKMLSTSLDLLINRGVDDTRTEQLIVFLSQLDFFEVISGKGHYASYRFGSELWTAVDNQWLYLLWWGGLIPVLCYFYLAAIIPLKMIWGGNLTYETKVECFVLILWVLGLTGLAIYSTMSVEFFFFIISIILGRILYKYSVGVK